MTHYTDHEFAALLAHNTDLSHVTDRGTRTVSKPTPVAVDTRRITLDYPPSSNRYWRVYNNHVVRSTAATAYIDHVGSICALAGIQPLDGDVAVTLRVYRPMRRGDLDNRIKIVLDALQGFAYMNDEQVVAIHATRHDDKVNPRVELEIARLEPTL